MRAGGFNKRFKTQIKDLQIINEEVPDYVKDKEKYYFEKIIVSRRDDQQNG